MKVLLPGMSCVINAVAATDELTEAVEAGYSFIYILTPTGIFLRKRLRPGRGGKARFVQSKVDKVPGLEIPKIESEIVFLPDGKIPHTLLAEVESFFRRVIEVKKTPVEAMIWIMWNEEKGYFLHVPRQIVSKASAKYDWTDLPENSSIIVDIHSHADFGAFFSGTDDNDDKDRVGFSGVIGHNNTDSRSYAWRFNNGKDKLQATVQDLFSIPPKLQVSIPDDWVEKVADPVVARPPAMYHHGGHYIPQYTGGGSYPRGNAEFGGRHPFYPAQGESRPGPNSPKHETSEKGPGKKSNPGVGAERPNARSNVISLAGSQSSDFDSRPSISDHLDRMTPRQRMGQTTPFSTEGSFDLVDIPEHDLGFGVSPAGYGATSLYDILEAAAGMSPERHAQALEGIERRQQLADLIEDEGELTNFVEARYVRADDIEFKLERDGSVKVSVPAEDLPSDFDTNMINHGRDVAIAAAVIEAVSADLIDSGAPLRNTTEAFFGLIPDGEKLACFRTLAALLPDEAMQKLNATGL